VDKAYGPSSRHSCPLTLRLIGSGSSSEVPTLFSYDAEDPFAVRMTFGDDGSGGESDVTWLVSRELMHEGLSRPAGDGDVLMGPGAATDVLFLYLRPPMGEALFELSRSALTAFLRGTELLVPFGAEAAALDLDDELVTLLANGGADPGGC
jgi:hypothetical protein